MKPLRIIFNKSDRYIRKYDRSKYLGLFPSDEKYERILDKIMYLIVLERNIPDVYSHKHLKIKNQKNNKYA